MASHRTRITVAGLLVALIAAGCGSSKSVSTAPAPKDVPAVDGVSNRKAAPTIHAGTGTPPPALRVADLVVGSGAVASSANTVEIQYVGALYTDGSVFDSSWSRGQPASFPLSGVIPGFAQGIVGMKVGGRRELVIPPSLGYGAQAQDKIPANSTLVFVIDLLGVS